jgi:hypothetical protein
MAGIGEFFPERGRTPLILSVGRYAASVVYSQESVAAQLQYESYPWLSCASVWVA